MGFGSPGVLAVGLTTLPCAASDHCLNCNKPIPGPGEPPVRLPAAGAAHPGPVV